MTQTHFVKRWLSRTYDPTPAYRPRMKRGYAYVHRFGILYNTKAWRLLRSTCLNTQPLCAMCGRLAEEVDHIVPHRGNRRLFHDRNNLQSVCKQCHKMKTRTERRHG